MKTLRATLSAAIFLGRIFLAVAANQGPQASSQANRELEMTVRIDATVESQSKVPKFRVELRNIGEHDLILNLGIMLANGRKQYPNAIVLTITDSQGKVGSLTLESPRT